MVRGSFPWIPAARGVSRAGRGLFVRFSPDTFPRFRVTPWRRERTHAACGTSRFPAEAPRARRRRSDGGGGGVVFELCIAGPSGRRRGRRRADELRGAGEFAPADM